MILILRNYNSRDQTEDNIGRAHGTYMGRGKCKGVVGKLKENRPLGKQRHRQKDNIKLDLKEKDERM